MSNVANFDLEQQICFRSPEAALPLIQRLSADEATRCIDYEKARHNRREMLALLHQQRVSQLLIEMKTPPVMFTVEEVDEIRAALTVARSSLQCGSPPAAEVSLELRNAITLIDKALS